MIDLIELQRSDLNDIHLIIKNPGIARFLPEQSYESIESVLSNKFYFLLFFCFLLLMGINFRVL